MKTSNARVLRETETKLPGIAYKILRVFTVIHPGEGLTVFLLTLNVFLLLAAYYIIKPVRDALMLSSWPAEIKSYLGAAIAVLLIFVVKIFSSIASRFPRQKLITWVTLFFISNLGLFYILHLSGIGPGTMGIIFFIWAGIFNLIIIAQFWGFASDLYSEEEGKRLFPIVAFGATFGGFVGGKITAWLVVPLGRSQLMLIAGGILGICILFTWIIHRREIKRADHKATKVSQGEESRKEEQEKPLEKGGAFRLVFKSRYLLYLAFFVLLLNFINTNGGYMLDTVAKSAAIKAVETGTAAGLDQEQFLTKFFAGFYNIMNLFAMFVQLFVVSRIFKWFGVRVAIFFLPALALGGYLFISLGAYLLLVKWVKALENGMDYSLMNTTRHSLFLITSREEKYKAQAVTKTFFHRSGDLLSAGLVFLGTTYLAFKVENFALVNFALVLIWIILGILIAKEHKKLSAQRTAYRVE
jgi:AAA family ATP:ADP antiporter